MNHDFNRVAPNGRRQMLSYNAVERTDNNNDNDDGDSSHSNGTKQKTRYSTA